jgi:hypothetical protein
MFSFHPVRPVSLEASMNASTWDTPGRAFGHSSQLFSVEEVRMFFRQLPQKRKASRLSLGLFKKTLALLLILAMSRIVVRWELAGVPQRTSRSDARVQGGLQCFKGARI